MTNTKKLVRPVFTVEEDVLDTMCIDYDEARSNVALIPFKQSSNNKKFYEQLVQNNQDQLREISPDEAKKSSYVLCLSVEPKKGHKLYNLDNCYDYYITTFITYYNGDNRCHEVVTEQLIDISEEEKVFIQRILWGHMPVTRFLKAQVEDVIKEQLPDVQYNLFSHCTINDEYHAVYRTVDKVLFATVKDYKNGMSPVILEV